MLSVSRMLDVMRRPSEFAGTGWRGRRESRLLLTNNRGSADLYVLARVHQPVLLGFDDVGVLVLFRNVPMLLFADDLHPAVEEAARQAFTQLDTVGRDQNARLPIGQHASQ